MTDHLPFVLARAFSVSTSEARRALAQGAVRVNGQTVEELDYELWPGDYVQLGKRRWMEVE